MKLFYRKLGQGKPLFILHGLFGLSDNWAAVGKILSGHFEVYLIDLRNHGSSPHSEEWTYPVMAEDVRELAGDIQYSISGQPSRIILLGHSLGGKVAIQFASMHPELLEKLIVADMAPKSYPGNSFGFIEKLLSLKPEKFKSRKEAETTLHSIVNDWATVQLLLKNLQWNEKDQLEWKFNLKVIAENRDAIGKTFSTGDLPVQIPSLFIRGEKSLYVLDTDIPEIKKRFPASEFKTIENAGHWVHADKPAEFARAVIEFAS